MPGILSMSLSAAADAYTADMHTLDEPLAQVAIANSHQLYFEYNEF